MIHIAEPNLVGNELKYLTECINTNWISSTGNFVKEFERKFAEFCGVNYATSCSNGTSALHLALLALDIKEEDEVIVPNLTFGATTAAVKHCNANPVLVDIDKQTWNIDPNKIKERITNKTKAIIVVHLFGNPCDMDKILEIAKENNLYVIEDCAQAHGAEYKNQKVGSIGDIGCFSFYGNKLLTTGEGGMCTSNNKEIIEKINLIKNHGMIKEKRYWHDIVGYNYRLTNIQAAIGLAQLERINDFFEKRYKLANLYKDLLKDIKEITYQETTADSKSVNWLFPILLNKKAFELIKRLSDHKIESMNMFYPLNEMKPYFDSSEFENSKLISENGLILPLHYNLTEEQIKEVCEVIKKEF
jgi:perosamine synthetase